MAQTRVLEPKAEAEDEFALEQRLYEESLKTLDEGQVLVGTIVAKSNDELLVDIGGKSEGVVTGRELSSGMSISEMKIGDTLEVLVYRIDSDGDGTMYLSEKRARGLKTWEKVLEAHEHNEAINATVTQVVKGGVLVDLGMRGFVPASQIRRHPVGNLDELVGKQLRLKVIDLDHKRRRVVLSQRVVLEEELNQKKQELLSTLAAGQIREGTVVRLADFGAFVDLGGIDGLIHNSELSWLRIKHPSEVVKIGDKVQVEIMKFDQDAKKVSLSLKHSLDDPWKSVPESLTEGSVAAATLIKVTANYLLVELFPGVTAMVPKSEFEAQDAPSPGDTVTVKLLSINVAGRRITASLLKASGTSETDPDIAPYLSAPETDAPPPATGVADESAEETSEQPT
ncbi:MAG: S1 RNA-binding domain-containing protein [Candidatus Eremiobacteraeota bacterium]|nr:S1 RNA-binding domain-containing protein [Candidatus Eremiobacteraeota bacterium]MBC5828554.1 S1 RNA-binding domain-containing protein [Candidatus Eremiobacteraeota bacterium]